MASYYINSGCGYPKRAESPVSPIRPEDLQQKVVDGSANAPQAYPYAFEPVPRVYSPVSPCEPSQPFHIQGPPTYGSQYQCMEQQSYPLQNQANQQNAKQMLYAPTPKYEFAQSNNPTHLHNIPAGQISGLAESSSSTQLRQTQNQLNRAQSVAWHMTPDEATHFAASVNFEPVHLHEKKSQLPLRGKRSGLSHRNDEEVYSQKRKGWGNDKGLKEIQQSLRAKEENKASVHAQYIAAQAVENDKSPELSSWVQIHQNKKQHGFMQEQTRPSHLSDGNHTFNGEMKQTRQHFEPQKHYVQDNEQPRWEHEGLPLQSRKRKHSTRLSMTPGKKRKMNICAIM
jgi:hypothetical protein